jgi:hypothetical protein
MLLEEFAMKTNRFSVVLGDKKMIGRRVTDRLLAWLGGKHRRTAEPHEHQSNHDTRRFAIYQ